MTEAIAHDEHHHGEHHHDNSPEAIKKEIRKYLYVFYSLAFLTGVTVWISTFHFPTWIAVTLALAVALVKGSLVAAFFMHLLSERKLIYAVLVLTVFFFGMMIWGPWHHRNNARDVWPNYDATSSAAPPATQTQHGSGH